MGNENSGRKPFKDEEEIRKNRNARMLRYYYHKKQKALDKVEEDNKDFLNKFKNELNDLFFKTDMDYLNANNLRFSDIKQTHIGKNIDVYLIKLDNGYIWKYKNLISNVLPLEKAIKDAKKALI